MYTSSGTYTVTLYIVDTRGCCATITNQITVDIEPLDVTCEELCSGFVIDQGFEVFDDPSCNSIPYNQFNSGCIEDWYPAYGTADVFSNGINGVVANSGSKFCRFVDHEDIYTDFHFGRHRNYRLSMAGYLRSSHNGEYSDNLGFYAINGLSPNTTVGIPPYQSELGSTFPLLGELSLCENMWSEDCFEFSIQEGQSEFYQLLIHSTIVGGSNNAFRDIALDDVKLTCELVLLKGIITTNDGNGLFNFSPDFEVSDFTDNLTYAWDFGDGVGTSTDVYPSYQFSDIGTYNVCLKLSDESGCCENKCVQVEVTSFILCTPLQGFAHIYAPNGVNISTLTNQSILNGLMWQINGKLIINKNITITGSKFLMESGSEIEVAEGVKFTSTSNNFEACDQMWRGINLMTSVQLFFTLNTVRDAEYGINVGHKCVIKCGDNVFDKCVYGINAVAPINTFSSSFNRIYGNTFSCSNPLNDPYNGQMNYPSGFNDPLVPERVTVAGVRANKFGRISLHFNASSAPNQFTGIRNGVLSQSSIINSVRNEFSNLLGRYLPTTVNLFASGVGIGVLRGGEMM